VRGHSKACELALAEIASKRFQLEKITTHRFALKDVDLAIRSVGGKGVPDVIHASLMSWERDARSDMPAMAGMSADTMSR
jgi:hypothetical protein